MPPCEVGKILNIRMPRRIGREKATLPQTLAMLVPLGRVELARRRGVPPVVADDFQSAGAYCAR